jgi:hypothetical protein
MEVTLKDLLRAINILGDDRDVTVDGIDSASVCPPVKMTPAGRKQFEQALSAKVIVEYGKDDDFECFYVSDDDEETDEQAWELLVALAGDCSADDYDKWFEGKDAELI